MRKTLVTMICILLVLLAVVANIIIVKTAPKAEKQRPPKMAALIEAVPLTRADETVVLHLTGTVIPAEEIMLRARVAGEIVAMADAFIDGGLLSKDNEILQIDPVDYRLALSDTESRLEKARFDYKLELGRKDVAQREWELLKTEDASEQERELALRIPHLAASKAALAAAESALEKARLDLARTTIRAPFNAVVLERKVNIGSQASLQDQLARLAGTDAFWVQVSVPVDRLEWITIPGSETRILSNGGAERSGRVIKLLGELENKGRMARLLVHVDDPLCRKPENIAKKALLIGEYVRAEIDGRILENVFSIPRQALHENRLLWIAREGRLDIRKVDVLWRDASQVLVRDNLSDGELLITSDLTAPIQGMAVNTGREETGQDKGMKADGDDRSPR